MEWLNYHHLLYFWAHQVRPELVAELDDLALASVFGEAGKGIFAVPELLAREIRQRHGVQLVGHAREVRQRFYAISVERKIKHPGVIAICEAARRRFLAP